MCNEKAVLGEPFPVISLRGKLCMAICDGGSNGESGKKYTSIYEDNCGKIVARIRKPVPVFSILNRSRRPKKGGGIRL
jgi:hypothetical protein